MAWICPKCTSDNLEVQISTWAKLIQEEEDDNFQTDLDESSNHDHEWGAESPMTCQDCGHAALADDFDTDVQEEDDE